MMVRTVSSAARQDLGSFKKDFIPKMGIFKPLPLDHALSLIRLTLFSQWHQINSDKLFVELKYRKSHMWAIKKSKDIRS